MHDEERTAWGFLLALVCVALIATSFVLPWFHFHFSTGPRAPNDPGQGGDPHTRTEVIDYYPLEVKGNATPSDPAGANQSVAAVGWLAGASGGAAVLFVILEVPLPFVHFSTRRVSLALAFLGSLSLVAALAWAWIVFPQTLSARGVDGAFTSRLRSDGYVQTYLAWGWVAGLGALLAWFVAAAFKFQAGAYDPGAVEDFVEKPK